jgi:hypothetical protein
VDVDADIATRNQIRDCGLEILVSIEYLPAFQSEHGIAAFGVLCEMVGKCLQHVACGRYAEALVHASRIGRPILDAVQDPRQREPFQRTYEAFIGSLESMHMAGPTTIH